MADADELCPTCSAIDVYSLFTGTRRTNTTKRNEVFSLSLSTLENVQSNTKCPFCRLLNHAIHGDGYAHPWQNLSIEEFDPSKVLCAITPIRADENEEMLYADENVKELIATNLQVKILPMEGLSQQITAMIGRGYPFETCVQLLSPDSVDPARPLLNGYPATRMDASLSLLRNWMDTCVASHGTNCERASDNDFVFEFGIRVIDVENLMLVDTDLAGIQYAALSYVWGSDQSQYLKLREFFQGGKAYSALPTDLPRVISDAIQVCKEIHVPFLWVDLYCIHQHDPVRKASEIRDMGHVYRQAKITLVAGSSHSAEAGLFPNAEEVERRVVQKVETVQGRTLITTLPSITNQIQASKWVERSWTMQEGQLATRCAYFGGYDVSFLCGSGHWRESLHSGPKYAHNADIKDINTAAEGYHMLSAFNWLNNADWKFDHYAELLSTYSTRQLSWEQDKLNAIAGCLKLIEEAKDVTFVQGLPTRDFHYALLWKGENDRKREGFPTWAWTGWHSLQNLYFVMPDKGESCSLIRAEDGTFSTREPKSAHVELDGSLISGPLPNLPSSATNTAFADIIIAKDTAKVLNIKSESIHLSIDVLPADVEDAFNKFSIGHDDTDPDEPIEIPSNYDSTLLTRMTLEAARQYSAPLERLRFRDKNGNTYDHKFPYWSEHFPIMTVSLPWTVSGETLDWLVSDGLEFVRIMEIKTTADEKTKETRTEQGAEDEDGDKLVDHVLGLGIDRRNGKVQRFGMFCFPKKWWDAAGPESVSLEME
jgi:hypothetical protein